MAECSPSELMEEGACFQCLDQQGLLIAMNVLLCRINQAYNPMASCDPTELLEEGKCFQCLSGEQLQIAAVQLLCNISAAIGGTPAKCGEGNPNTEGVVGDFCGQIYLDTTDSSYFVWNSTESFWV